MCALVFRVYIICTPHFSLFSSIKKNHVRPQTFPDTKFSKYKLWHKTKRNLSIFYYRIDFHSLTYYICLTKSTSVKLKFTIDYNNCPSTSDIRSDISSFNQSLWHKVYIQMWIFYYIDKVDITRTRYAP
jgi:hypothetical protein